MKIAYVSNYDYHDVDRWSGLPHYMATSLASQNVDFDFIHARYQDAERPLSDRLLQIPYSIKHKIYTKFLHKNYLWAFDLYYLRYFAARANKSLANSSADVIFGPGHGGACPLPFLETNKPIVFWDDSTTAGLLNQYPNLTNLCSETLKNAQQAQQLLLDRASIAVFASSWAAQSAVDFYNINSDKIRIIPFGANIKQDLDIEDMKQLVNTRPKNHCKLIFIGVDPIRKNLKLAIELTENLNKAGLQTTLTVVGCDTKSFEPLPSCVTSTGYVSKQEASGQNFVNKLLGDSHFLLLPSELEAFGIVICEANALGVPCITSDRGGIVDITKNANNGIALPLDIYTKEGAKYILQLFEHYASYEELCLSSYNEYKVRLNWTASGKALVQSMQELL